jgi:ABC-type uncharacterized transport system involved in gliding motility auxiliary subunit
VSRIVGLLGWLGVVLVLAAVVLRFQGFRAEWQEWSRPLALAGLVVTAIYALSQWRDIGRSFQGRNVRYGSLAAGSIVVFLAILVAVNWIANRQHKRWDLTASQQFSLSDQTRQVLTELEEPLVIKAFYESGTGGPASLQSMQDRLEEYDYTSDMVTVDYIDAVRDPLQARNYQVQTYGTLVLEYGGRTERTTQADEQSVTNALKKVIEGQAKKIYFVQGHGEHEIEDTDRRTGYSGFVESLETDNFEVASLPLAQQGQVPEDATLVVIAGPKTDYFAPEIDAIRAFLRKGGKLLMLLDPPDSASAPALTNLIAFAREWGVTPGQDIVVDASGMGRLINAGPEVPIAMPVEPGHAITRDFRLMTAFPLTRSVSPIEGGADGRVAQTLLQTSPQSWAETNLQGLFATSQPEQNPEAGDVPGPVSIAAAVATTAPEAPEPASPDLPRAEARVVVVGDSDFASNAALSIQGNRDLALNMANWLAQQENLIAIRPRDPQDRRIQLTEDQSQRVFWLALLVIPGLLIANGVRVWWKRR